MKHEKSSQNRMSQDINNTSRTMQPNLGGPQKQGAQNSMPGSKSGSSPSNLGSSPGRGWHGDSKGHAKAGSQSHKRTGNRHS
ncbi:hypothetical protein [uncultured Pontibacter sp.]|uniref:hypothetical protein n=1 Tax=uncultured Pontibacter sp. TaxID=453356 RepID=UPI00261E6E76|nr:hypothetical protein [uncultured Pontibacter sp.]